MAQLIQCSLNMIMPWVRHPALHQLGIIAHASKPSTTDIEEERSEVQGLGLQTAYHLRVYTSHKNKIRNHNINKRKGKNKTNKQTESQTKDMGSYLCIQQTVSHKSRDELRLYLKNVIGSR